MYMETINHKNTTWFWGHDQKTIKALTKVSANVQSTVQSIVYLSLLYSAGAALFLSAGPTRAEPDLAVYWNLVTGP